MPRLYVIFTFFRDLCIVKFSGVQERNSKDLMDSKFEWDEYKASLNVKRHGVSFEEAKTVFDDPIACIFEDEWHSVGEYREIIIGHSAQNRLETKQGCLATPPARSRSET